MTNFKKLTFRKGERRKNQNWRAFTIVSGNITRSGVLVQFDADPTTGREGQRQFMDTQWVAEAEAVA